MMAKNSYNLYQKKEELCRESILLNESSMNAKNTFERTQKMRKKKDDAYKKYKFYDNFLKAREKVR